MEKWIALPNGIPCGNTFLRVFAAIDPAAFTGCLTAFVTRICPELAEKLVAIGGKTPRPCVAAARLTKAPCRSCVSLDETQLGTYRAHLQNQGAIFPE